MIIPESGNLFDPNKKPWVNASNPEIAKQAYYDMVFGKQVSTNTSFDLNPLNLAYRADTKQQYYQDFAYALFEVGAAYVTGGAGRVLRAVEGLFQELILKD